MKISIVTPSFNQGQYLQQAIDSVVNQHYPDWEHIIYDAGSTDNTVAILEKYQKQFPNQVWFVSEPDNGQSDALNKGLRKATGDIVVWLSTDDWFANGAFHTTAEFFKNHSNVGMVYGRCIVHDTTEAKDREYEFPTQNFSMEKLLNDNNFMVYITVYWRRELLHSIGYFNESLHYSMDLDYYIRVGRKTHIQYIPQILGHFRIHQDSKSGGQEDKFWKEWRKVSRKYGGKFFSIAWKRRLNSVISHFVTRTPRWLRRAVFRIKRTFGVVDSTSSVYEEMREQ